MSTHIGQPRWNGKLVEGINLTRFLLPAYAPGPFTVQIDGCDDFFLTVFSTEEKLREWMVHFTRKLSMPSNYSIKQIDNSQEFCESVWGQGVRIMLDPICLSDHHTKWLEIVREGEQFKFQEYSNT